MRWNSAATEALSGALLLGGALCWAPRWIAPPARAQTLPSAPPAAAMPSAPEPMPLVQRPSHAPLIASYTLHAKLDAERHTVAATGTITWNNPSREPTRELYLHLYLNAFKNEKSVFLRSPFGAGRSGSRAP